MSKLIDKDIYLLKNVTNLESYKVQKFMDSKSKNVQIWKSRTFVVVLSEDNNKKHLSISHSYRYPTWEEIKYVKYELFKAELSELEMAMYLPKPSEFVNIHKTTFHLYEV